MAEMNWRLAAGWLLAVVVTTAVAWQIVAVADERVGDRPVSPVQAAPTTTIQLSEATVPTPPPEPTLPPPVDDLTTTTTTLSETTSTTDDGAVTSSPTSTPSTSPTSTTSTTAAARWSTKTIATSGGTVVVSYRPGEVVYETAVPSPGFETEIEKTGPPVVEVQFDSNSLRVDIKAEWKSGALDVEVEEESHDD